MGLALFVKLVLWLLLFPMVYPLKLVLQGTKASYSTIQKIDLRPIPGYVSSITMSLYLTSANIISILGHSIQTTVHSIVQEFIRKIFYISKVLEQILLSSNQIVVRLVYRIYQNVLGLIENLKTSKSNSINANSSSNETEHEVVHNSVSASPRDPLQKTTSFLSTHARQFSSMCRSMLSSIYSVPYALIRYVITICKTAITWSIMTIVLPFVFAKQCIMRIITTISSSISIRSVQKIENKNASPSPYVETEHATFPSTDQVISNKTVDTLYNDSIGATSSITTKDINSINDENNLQIKNEKGKTATHGMQSDTFKGSHRYEHATSSPHILTEKITTTLSSN